MNGLEDNHWTNNGPILRGKERFEEENNRILLIIARITQKGYGEQFKHVNVFLIDELLPMLEFEELRFQKNTWESSRYQVILIDDCEELDDIFTPCVIEMGKPSCWLCDTCRPIVGGQ